MTQQDITTLVQDPFLRSILQTSQAAREATLNLLKISGDAIPPTWNGSSTVDESQLLLISRHQKKLNALLARLRGKNRKLAHTVRQEKAHTSASRAEVDTLHLSLQNLYYESRHLRGEIRTCDDFDHAYARIPMIGEDEFLAQDPQWRDKLEAFRADEEEQDQQEEDEEMKIDEAAQAGPEIDAKAKVESADGQGEGDVEGDFMRARIEKEYQDRVDLEQQRKALVSKKTQMMKENAKRKEELGKLDTDLEKFIEAARPIQKTFEKTW